MSKNGTGGNGAAGGSPKSRNDGAGRPLPKRFYKLAAAAPKDGGWRIELDGRGARTPGKRELMLPSKQLAAEVAAEWAAQVDHIDPAAMPLTRLVNTALDGVAGRQAEVAADVVKYSLSDLLCYRAEQPEGLVARQAQLWDPVLDWAEERLNTRFVRQIGLMPVSQSPITAAAMAEALTGLDALRLAALHVMTSLTGSALLALAVLEGRLDADTAWSAAHVDEDWQIAEWGEDAEAVARRQRRSIDMQAAAKLMRLLAASS